MTKRSGIQGRYRDRRAAHVMLVAAFSLSAAQAKGQTVRQIERFEFATSDEAAAAGVTDLTDFANRPAFYINGECAIPPSPCDEVAEGTYSIGTDAAFCTQFCEAGSRVGFRRFVDELQFPDVCPGGGHFVPLDNTYADPDFPGTGAADFPLSELQVLLSAYGDGSFADGPTGTHLWLNLVDCEGEIFEYINFSEGALYVEPWTFDLAMGADIIRLSPDSIVDGQPIGDGLLTEIAAIECLIQDADNPPTSFGKWYIDDVRVIEPEGGPDVPAVSTWGVIATLLLLCTAGTILFRPSIRVVSVSL